MTEKPTVQKNRIDHDKLFKELLITFFQEFIELFFPDFYPMIDFNETEFLSEEIFTDIQSKEKKYIDILAKVKAFGEPSGILIHVEPQSYYREHFNKRMYKYYNRLFEKYDRKIMPIVIFAHNRKAEEPDNFEITLFGTYDVVKFKFFKIQLKTMNWKDYINSNNPVAAALLSKMNYSKKERVSLKAEFLRMLLKMKLDPARMTLLHVFFDTYIKLNLVEEEELREVIKASLEEEKILEMITIYEKRGREEGRQEAIRELILKLLDKHGLSFEINKTLAGFNLTQLEKVAEKILDIRTSGDLLAVIEQVKQD